jgi:prolipoprotein diacylglyceryl transferase
VTLTSLALPLALPASIPSPEQSVWYLGPVPLRAYALCIIAGIIAGLLLTERRWERRGGQRDAVMQVAYWAIPLGILGARLYHVISDNQLYFDEGRDPWQALRLWEGGLSIFGAVLGGALGVWIASRRYGIKVLPFLDAAAPGLVLAQAIGRWGNWFNQELYGRPTDVPWSVEIAPENRPSEPPEYAAAETFHPTFLYESLWNLGIMAVLLWADRRFRMGHGRVFALYVALYGLGRMVLETVRVDPANEILGMRVNFWVSLLLSVLAVVYIAVSRRRRPGREDVVGEAASEQVG